jgi:uncharacterized protein with ParB-like and HNH nuclease domain
MELQSIDKIFEKKIFRIPSYQRGYSWSNNNPININSNDPYKNVTGQLKDLWDDIMNIDNYSWHYTGLLTLIKVESDYSWLSTHEQYSIVDGQQRITTILILISVLIEKADKLGFEYGHLPGYIKSQFLKIHGPVDAIIFGYDADNPSDKFFKRHILKDNSIMDDTKESIYTENLKKSKSFFEDCVSIYISKQNLLGIDEKTSLKNIFEIITTKLKFNQYILPKELNEYVVFETMNNRGKPLSELEKLKNRLMYLNDKLPLFNPNNTIYNATQTEQLLIAQHQDTISKIDTAWITIYQSLGANKSNPLNDEEFVYNHWIIYFDEYDRSEASVYSNFLFDTHFTVANVYNKNIDKQSLETYIKSLQESSVVWNKLNNLNYFDSTENEYKNLLIKLNRVGLKASFKPLILAILLHPNRESYKPIISILEEFSFKLFYISNKKSNTGDSKLYKLAYRICQCNLSATDAMNEIKGFIDYYYNFILFKNQVNELFKTGDQFGFYKWSGIKYFLFEYDLRLRMENNISDKSSEINWADFIAKNSIEHIFPQSAAMSFEDYCDCYQKTDMIIARVDYDKLQNDWNTFANVPYNERWAYCNSLGNLLALTGSLNSSISNDKFDFKKDQGLKSPQHQNKGFKYDSYSARIVSNSNEWNPENIKNRGLKMIEFLWSKLHPNQPNALTINEKYELLGFDFLNKPLTVGQTNSN